ncbi:MAG: MgtC/SapB family protein [Nanoarchaeota archaeon]
MELIYEQSIRILVVASLCILIGWEREMNHKPAGIKTHVLVGACSQIR